MFSAAHSLVQKVITQLRIACCEDSVLYPALFQDCPFLRVFCCLQSPFAAGGVVNLRLPRCLQAAARAMIAKNAPCGHCIMAPAALEVVASTVVARLL